MSGKRTVEDFFRVEASSSDVTQERERNISGSSGSVDIPTISRSSSLMSLGSEPEDSRPGTQASDQVDVVIAGGCSISSQELQTIKDKMAALTNYYKLSHVIKSKNAPDTSSKVLGKTIKVYNLKAKCQKCFAEVSFWNNTTGNLVSHYKTKHTHDLSELKAAISRTSRRGLKHPSGDDQPQRHQLSLKESFGQATRFTQDKGKEAMTKWFARCLIPLSITDHPATREMFQVFQPEFRVPSRRTLTRDIKAMGEEAREEIKSILKDLPHVATTADSWTAHNRSFIGSTVHWIDPTDLSRKMATLAIKEIKVSQTKGIIATKLDQVNRAFNISRKVVLTTTDNGANYVAAFSNYGSGIGEAEEDATNPDVEEVINSPEDQEEQEREGLDIISVTMALAAAAAVQDSPRLPKHQRCSAHTVNLLASIDVSQVHHWNYGRAAAPFKKTLARAQGLWNLQNRSSTSANTIKQVVGRKLPTPVVTRWNSLYDACSVLLQRVMDDDARLEAVNEVLRNEGGTNRNRTSYYGFDDQDKQVLQEYCKVMKPLANCLDRLQTEENAYLGVLLPTLTLMRVALERMEEARGDQALTYAKPLVRALLRQEGNKGGFNNRFSAMFKDLDLLMASALHPNYGMTTFNSVAPNMKEEIFQRIVKEMKALIRQETEERDNSQDMEAMEEHEEVSADPFAELCDTTQADQEDDLEEDIKKELLAWKRSKEATLKKSHFPAKYRDQWVTLFIKYNTGIPSSAAVERLFSTAGDVLRPKRACLSEDNFEYLVFLKGNLHLLKQKFKVPRGVDEEDEEMF